jgi:hypothetical protein
MARLSKSKFMKIQPSGPSLVIVASFVLALCACSMATSIQRDALDYNAGVANYNDQMLIYTILRARDDAPINLLALSTINGAVSVQSTLGATAGYKTVTGTNFAASVSPSVGVSSSPTWSMASLNTQGFTLGIIQPISPMYIVSKWSTGLDREFLLRLFIKSINIKEPNGYHEYLNDPNSPAAMAAFSTKLHSWFPGVSMRALTVLEPLGPALDPSTVTSVSTTSEGGGAKSSVPSRIVRTDVANAANTSLLGAYQYLMPLGGGSFYIGNAAPRTPDGSLRLQLYREYPQQVVLCVSRKKIGTEALASSVAPLGAENEEEEALSHYALALKAAAKGGAGKTNEPATSNPSGATNSGSNGNSGFHQQQVGSLAVNLKVDRVAAVLPLGACGQDELVLPAYTEEENAKDSGTYSHVEWRSIAEVIDYLGALLRVRNTEADQWTGSAASGAVISHTLFRLSSDSQSGFTQVTYRGIRYAIDTDNERDPAAPQNHSLQALSLLNELVSAAKVSSDIPNTQEIQFVP